MTAVAAIETRYKGYRFRSRLEARWAVFFDQCKQHFLYEDQGYRLPSGSYLPDFYFPEWNGFIEVKPAHLLPRRHFEFGQYYGSWPIRDDLPRELLLAHELFTLFGDFGLRSFVVGYGDPYDVLSADGEGGAVQIDHRGLRTGSGLIRSFPNLCSGAEAARAARFEHGEGRS